jgi:hypothetical protein
LVVEALMVALEVVVLDELGDGEAEMPLAPDGISSIR